MEPIVITITCDQLARNVRAETNCADRMTLNGILEEAHRKLNLELDRAESSSKLVPVHGTLNRKEN